MRSSPRANVGKAEVIALISLELCVLVRCISVEAIRGPSFEPTRAESQRAQERKVREILVHARHNARDDKKNYRVRHTFQVLSLAAANHFVSHIAGAAVSASVMGNRIEVRLLCVIL